MGHPPLCCTSFLYPLLSRSLMQDGWCIQLIYQSTRTGHLNARHTRTVATPQQSAWPYSRPLSSATTKLAVQPTNLVLRIIPPPLRHSNSNNLRQASQSQHQCNIKTKTKQIKTILRVNSSRICAKACLRCANTHVALSQNKNHSSPPSTNDSSTKANTLMINTNR